MRALRRRKKKTHSGGTKVLKIESPTASVMIITRAGREKKLKDSLKWLLDFTSLNLSTLDEKGWSEVENKFSDEMTNISLNIPRTEFLNTRVELRWTDFTKAYLQSLQPELKECLDTLLDMDGSWDSWLRKSGNGSYLEAWKAPIKVYGTYLKREGHEIREVRQIDPENRVWLHIVYLLKTFGSHIRRCAVCRKLYLRTGRQLSCSPKCAQHERWKRWYTSNQKKILSRLRKKRKEKVA